MSIPLPKLPTSTHPRFATDASDPPCRFQYGWLYDEKEVRAIQREAMRAALEAAAKVCDVTPPQPFRPSIEAAWAIRKLEIETADETASRAAAAMMAGKPYVCRHPRASYGDPWVCLDCGFEGPSAFRNKEPE